MNTQPETLSADALLREADSRLAQAPGIFSVRQMPIHACRRANSPDRDGNGLDFDGLAGETRGGRARIPERSLTRKARLVLKAHGLTSPN
jgi:hypothetical protein